MRVAVAAIAALSLVGCGLERDMSAERADMPVASQSQAEQVAP